MTDLMGDSSRGSPTTLSARMTAIDGGAGESRGDIFYVSTCAIQAQIALLHLERIWAVEGDPPDVHVWEGAIDELDVRNESVTTDR